MDEEADGTDSPDVQESLMGALIGARGVPGGLQGVSTDAPESTEEVSGLSEGTAELLGISAETLESVSATAKEPATIDESEVVDPTEITEAAEEPQESAPVEDHDHVLITEESQVTAPAEAEVPEPAAAQVVEVDEPTAVAEPEPDPEPEPRVEEPVLEVDEPTALVEPELDPEPVPSAEPEVVVPDPAAEEVAEPAAAVSEPHVEVEVSDNIDDPDPDGVGRVVLEWAVVLVGAVVMALVLRQFIFQAFWIPSESMETTLEIRDRVLVNRLSYQWGDVSRGDIVVFARRPEEVGEIRDLIKRVIGLPGETVEGRDDQIYIDGVRLDEPYVDEINRNFGDFGPVPVPDNELFVMGDNRDQSFDSRLFGTVEQERVTGRAFVTFWPLDRIGSL